MGYFVGDTVILNNSFYFNALLTDPTTVVLTVTDPSGSVTNYYWPSPDTIVHDAQGQFHVELTVGLSGNWKVLWQSTGAVASSTETGFYVSPPLEEVTIHVQDGSSNPVAGVNVSIWENDVTITAGGTTDGSGNVVVNVLPGSYTVELSKPKVSCANPYTITVLDDSTPQTFVLVCTPLTIAAPSPVPKVKLFGYMTGSDGQPASLVRVVVETVGYGRIRPWVRPGSPATGVDPTNVMVRAEKRELVTDQAGYWEADVVPDTTIRVEVPDVRFSTIFRVPNDPRITTLDLRDARPDPGTAQGMGVDSDVGSRGMIGGES